MSHPYPPFGTSDPNDDDGQVLDDLLTDTHDAPRLDDINQPIPVPAPVEPIPATRLYGSTVSLAAGSTAQRLLTEDKNRKTLVVKVASLAASPTSADYAIISDESSKISAGSPAISLVGRNTDIFTLVGHTGALWVIPGPSLTANIEVTVLAVTEV